MAETQEQVECAIREAARKQGINLMLPENAFLLAKNTPQGWLLVAFSDMGAAFAQGGLRARQGNTEVYVLNSANGGITGFKPDGQPDWQ